ncbi:MAG TPA: hypothetical protein VF003_13915 [Pseudonocardiaceae bacterium]
MSTPQVTVQLPHREPAAVAHGLLAWADTLTQVTAQVWRVPHGDSVHLSITGSMTASASVLVYGGLPTHRGGLGTYLTPGATTTVPLAALRHAPLPRRPAPDDHHQSHPAR